MENLDSTDQAFWRGLRGARGPGIHTDEASSALDALAEDGLSERAWTELHDASTGARENPSSDGQRDVTIVPMKELIPIAYLVTGQWGIERASLRRSLPIVGQPRSNPTEERSDLPFFKRMDVLEGLLAKQIKVARARYKQKGVTDSGKMDWIPALETMRKAVVWVAAMSAIEPRRRTIRSGDWFLGLPRGSWSPLSEAGNSKLPFVSYSELPMATCPGAGACGVAMDAFDVRSVRVPVLDPKTGKPAVYKSGSRAGQTKTKTKTVRGQRGWCYSFRSWRYPDSFKRQFLSTLANYADREFAILAAGGSPDPRRHNDRAQAAIDGAKIRGMRIWMRSIGASALELTARDREKKPAFMRLFVDGDINSEDCIVEWMQTIRGFQGKGKHTLEVYGYSKSWQQFINVHRAYGASFWPSNYVVNLSSGSVYASSKFSDVRGEMERLPVSRGYFEAIDTGRFIKQLEEQTRLFEQSPNGLVPMPKPKVAFEQFRFSPERIRMMVRVNAVKSTEQAVAALPEMRGVLEAAVEKNDGKPLTPEKIRQKTLHTWLGQLVRDPSFGAYVRKELAKDNDGSKEPAYYESVEAISRKALKNLVTGEGLPNDPSAHVLERKALAIVLQETLWTFGLGGSCPLICGNCSDHPTNVLEGVHRCAAKPGSPFHHATIHIGLH